MEISNPSDDASKGEDVSVLSLDDLRNERAKLEDEISKAASPDERKKSEDRLAEVKASIFEKAPEEESIEEEENKAA